MNTPRPLKPRNVINTQTEMPFDPKERQRFHDLRGFIDQLHDRKPPVTGLTLDRYRKLEPYLRQKYPTLDVRSAALELLRAELSHTTSPDELYKKVVELFYENFDPNTYNDAKHANNFNYREFYDIAVSNILLDLLEIIEDLNVRIPGEYAPLIKALKLDPRNVEITDWNPDDLSQMKMSDDSEEYFLKRAAEYLDIKRKYPGQTWRLLGFEEAAQVNNLSLKNDTDSTKSTTALLSGYMSVNRCVDVAISKIALRPAPLPAKEAAMQSSYLYLKSELEDYIKELIVQLIYKIGIPPAVIDKRLLLEDGQELNKVLRNPVDSEHKLFMLLNRPITEFLIQTYPAAKEWPEIEFKSLEDGFKANVPTFSETEYKSFEDSQAEIKRAWSNKPVDIDRLEASLSIVDSNTPKALKMKDELKSNELRLAEALKFQSMEWLQDEAKLNELTNLIKEIQAYVFELKVRVEDLEEWQKYRAEIKPVSINDVAEEQAQVFSTTYRELLKYTDAVPALELSEQRSYLKAEFFDKDKYGDRHAAIGMLLELAFKVPMSGGHVDVARLEALIRERLFPRGAKRPQIQAVVAVILQTISNATSDVSNYQRQLLASIHLDGNIDVDIDSSLTGVFVEGLSKISRRSPVTHLITNLRNKGRVQDNPTAWKVNLISHFEQVEDSIPANDAMWIGLDYEQEHEIIYGLPTNLSNAIDTYQRNIEILYELHADVNAGRNLVPVDEAKIEQWEKQMQEAIYNLIVDFLYTRLPPNIAVDIRDLAEGYKLYPPSKISQKEWLVIIDAIDDINIGAAPVGKRDLKAENLIPPHLRQQLIKLFPDMIGAVNFRQGEIVDSLLDAAANLNKQDADPVIKEIETYAQTANKLDTVIKIVPLNFDEFYGTAAQAEYEIRGVADTIERELLDETLVQFIETRIREAEARRRDWGVETSNYIQIRKIKERLHQALDQRRNLLSVCLALESRLTDLRLRANEVFDNQGKNFAQNYLKLKGEVDNFPVPATVIAADEKNYADKLAPALRDRYNAAATEIRVAAIDLMYAVPPEILPSNLPPELQKLSQVEQFLVVSLEPDVLTGTYSLERLREIAYFGKKQLLEIIDDASLPVNNQMLKVLPRVGVSVNNFNVDVPFNLLEVDFEKVPAAAVTLKPLSEVDISDTKPVDMPADYSHITPAPPPITKPAPGRKTKPLGGKGIDKKIKSVKVTGNNKVPPPKPDAPPITPTPDVVDNWFEAQVKEFMDALREAVRVVEFNPALDLAFIEKEFRANRPFIDLSGQVVFPDPNKVSPDAKSLNLTYYELRLWLTKDKGLQFILDNKIIYKGLAYISLFIKDGKVYLHNSAYEELIYPIEQAATTQAAAEPKAPPVTPADVPPVQPVDVATSLDDEAVTELSKLSAGELMSLLKQDFEIDKQYLVSKLNSLGARSKVSDLLLIDEADPIKILDELNSSGFLDKQLSTDRKSAYSLILNYIILYSHDVNTIIDIDKYGDWRANMILDQLVVTLGNLFTGAMGAGLVGTSGGNMFGLTVDETKELDRLRVPLVDMLKRADKNNIAQIISKYRETVRILSKHTAGNKLQQWLDQLDRYIDSYEKLKFSKEIPDWLIDLQVELAGKLAQSNESKNNSRPIPPEPPTPETTSATNETDLQDIAQQLQQAMSKPREPEITIKEVALYPEATATLNRLKVASQLIEFDIPANQAINEGYGISEIRFEGEIKPPENIRPGVTYEKPVKYHRIDLSEDGIITLILDLEHGFKYKDREYARLEIRENTAYIKNGTDSVRIYPPRNPDLSPIEQKNENPSKTEKIDDVGIKNAADVIQTIPDIYPTRSYKGKYKIFANYAQYTDYLKKQNIIGLSTEWVKQNITPESFRNYNASIGTGIWMVITAVFIEIQRNEPQNPILRLYAGIITGMTAEKLVPEEKDFPPNAPKDLKGLWDQAKTYLENAYYGPMASMFGSYGNMFGFPFGQMMQSQMVPQRIFQVATPEWNAQAKSLESALNAKPQDPNIIKPLALALLGLELNSQKQYKIAHRKLVRQWHPDVNSDPNAREVFQAIDSAYQYLDEHLK